MTFTPSERRMALVALVTAFRAGDDEDEALAYALGVVTIFSKKAQDTPLLRALLGDNDCEECGTPAGQEHAPYCRSAPEELDNDCDQGWSMEWLRCNTATWFKICNLCTRANRTTRGASPCADEDKCRFVPSLFQDSRPGHGHGGRLR
jgi:hypothetical protein